MLATSIVCGCYFYYVYGNRLIFSDAAMVCTSRDEEGVDPYPDSKLLLKTGTFLQRYSLAVQGSFAFLVTTWSLYFCCILISCRGDGDDEDENEDEEEPKT